MVGTLKNRFVVALLAVAAVPLIGIGAYSMHSNTAALRSVALATARERAQLRAHQVEGLLGDVRGDLFFMARSPVLFALLDELDGDPVQAAFWHRKLEQAFLALVGSKSLYACLRYIDARGQEVARAENDGLRSWLVPQSKLGNRAASGYFRSALASPPGAVHVSTGDRTDGEAREPVIRYALRATDRAGRARGALVIDVFVHRLIEGAGPWPAESGRVLLMDEADRPVSPPEAAPPEAGIRQRLAAGEGAVVAEAGDETVTWTAVWPATPGAPPMWLLVETAPRSQVFAALKRFHWVFALLTAAVVAAALLLSLFLARRIAGPLAVLRSGARRIADGDLDHRLEVRTGDEVQELAEEFNRMARALHATYRRLQRRDLAKTEQLDRVSRELVESQKLAAVGQLAAGVAHEINNPAGVVSMFAQQLLEGDGLEAAQRDKLRHIERHAERIGRITRDLLDFARPPRQARRRVDLGAALETTLAAWKPRLEAAGVACRLEAPPAPAAVLGDDEQLQQLFANLVLNAIQAMPDGGRLDIAVTAAGDCWQVVFADGGPGIPEEHMGHIFEPFFTTKETGQGTGLGLAIGYGIARAHGGRLRADNAPQGGARLWLELPAEAGSPVGAASGRPA